MTQAQVVEESPPDAEEIEQQEGDGLEVVHVVQEQPQLVQAAPWSIPAAALGAAEVLSSAAMTAGHVAGPGAAVAAGVAMVGGAWVARAHRVAGAEPVAAATGHVGGNGRLAGRGGGRGRGLGHAGQGIGRAGRGAGRGWGRGAGRGGGVSGGRVAGLRGRAGRVAGAPVRAAGRAEGAAARRVGGLTRAVAGRAAVSGPGRAARAAAGRAGAAGRRVSAMTAPARRAVTAAAGRSGQAWRTAAGRRRAVGDAVRGKGPAQAARAARTAARTFDKQQGSGGKAGAVRRVAGWTRSHVRALGAGAAVWGWGVTRAGLRAGWVAVARRLGITLRQKEMTGQEGQAEHAAPQLFEDKGQPAAGGGGVSGRKNAVGANTMAGSGFGQLLENLAGQMMAAASAYEPETMPVWAGDILHLSKALEGVSAAVSVLHAKMGDLPVDPAVADMLATSISLSQAAAQHAEETVSTFRALHAGELERHEAPRTNEQKWDVHL